MKKIESAGGVIINEKNEIVIVYTTTKSWQFPKGTVEEGESYLDTALREIKEETGLENLKLIRELPVYSRVSTQENNTRRYIHYFLFRTTKQKITPSAEVTNCKWVPINKVTDLLTYPEDKDFAKRIIRDNIVKIEKAQPEDLQKIIDIQKETWLATYPNKKFGITTEDILKRLGKPKDEVAIKRIENWQKIIKEDGKQKVIFIAKIKNKIIGLTIVNDQPKPTVGALYVLPSFHGQGAGDLLINKALEWLGKQPAIYTYVAIYNQNAINFYKKHSFAVTNKKPKDQYAVEHHLKEIPTIEMVQKNGIR